MHNGISGGIDSSYALILAADLGLRVLAVHMDNGWDSEIASNNIKKIVNKLKIDLYTYVINWEEYRKLMESFFDADVIDIEILYDNAMLSVCYKMAERYNLKYILMGMNFTSEGMPLPPNYNWFKYDKKNIKNIAKRKEIRIKTYPAIGTIDYVIYRFIKGISVVRFLDYFNYNKQQAIEILKTKFGFKPYPYKHYESVFTRFYQGYILPVKFGVDKRKVHFSSLIISNQMDRDSALQNLLDNLPYPSKRDIIEDIYYFLKKMKWDEQKFIEYLFRPEKPHTDYGSEIYLWRGLKTFRKNVINKFIIK